MAVLQPLIDLAQLCHLHGVTQAVISPGSRSAALTLAFARNPNIECQVVMDERAAGFVALGMAQQLKKPVVLICTSGSAAYNFAPAVAEAYFQQIPLVVLTADRPKEWIHQNDGQTIYQTEIYGKHVKEFWELPADYSHPDAVWFINRSVNEAMLTTQEFPSGPVHINVPIREPFYPKKEEEFSPSDNIRVIRRTRTIAKIGNETWQELMMEWERSEKILIAVGQQSLNEDLNFHLLTISEKLHLPILGDVISNLNNTEHFFSKHDLFLSDNNNHELIPDLLITIGQSFISKNLKQFLRNHPPKYHWHISEDKHVIDTFQILTQQVVVSPNSFLLNLHESINSEGGRFMDKEDKYKNYLAAWMKEEQKVTKLLDDFLQNLTTLNDITAVHFVLKQIPDSSTLHLANSMSVRYANILGIDKQNVEVFCNRGTSGIDGCVSTAIGAAMLSDQPVYLIVGDVAFFYDRNGLLIENFPDNLKIILLNNAGGTIFRAIEGPASQPELEEYFETQHNFNALRTADDSGITYLLIDHAIDSSLDDLKIVWNDFEKKKTASLLEIRTSAESSVNAFQDLKKFVRKRE
ncbi:2-succinyl-5-enolpyruvyl-6-hydroxy-3-cyclohexene-1-carboxylic-acid synthase [Persicitalea sp.]|uniref:2-succinyl-5-enolpyruvyl-6-hydroxy-3- cyclohexene-1-carboxylic-acid synthase n=1 Tax=Persicitalea sp. TaxID=3100273 RepID=UPI003592F1FA